MKKFNIPISSPSIGSNELAAVREVLQSYFFRISQGCGCGSDKDITLSFVKIEKKWRIFDPYNGSYFKNYTGEILSVEELKSGATWTIESLDKIN